MEGKNGNKTGRGRREGRWGIRGDKRGGERGGEGRGVWRQWRGSGSSSSVVRVWSSGRYQTVRPRGDFDAGASGELPPITPPSPPNPTAGGRRRGGEGRVDEHPIIK